MDLRELQRHWNGLGNTDPFWAIIGAPEKKGNRWDLDEFFATGVREIERLRAYVQALGVRIPGRRALDFGCGAGRITQALAPHFTEVCGVDIAPSMIELAGKLNRYGEKCQYFLNASEDLRLFDDRSFDFIYTNLVLQHMAPRYSTNYIREFLRLLAPGGLLVLQLPAGEVGDAPVTIWEELKHRIRPLVPPVALQWYRNARRRHRSGRLSVPSADPLPAAEPKFPRIEMYGVPRREVAKLLRASGARILDIRRNWESGPDWVSYWYCATR